MNVDRIITAVTTTMLIFIGVVTCILQTINFSMTHGNSLLTSYITEPDVPVSVIILLLVAMFIIPAISALVATMKGTLMTRIVHLIIMSIASAGVLAVLCQDIWTMGRVSNSPTFQNSDGLSVDSTTLCVARDTRISNFVLMIFGMLVLAVNLIYTGIVYCKSKTTESGEEVSKTGEAK